MIKTPFLTHFSALVSVLFFVHFLCAHGNDMAPSADDEKAGAVHGAAISVLIVTGYDYPGHLWQETTPVLEHILSTDATVKVTVVEDPDHLASDSIHQYDAIVLHFADWQKKAPSTESGENLERFVEAGGGLIVLHFACGAFQQWSGFERLAGRIYDKTLPPHDPYGRFRVTMTDNTHPITQGLPDFDTVDELYTCLGGDRPIHLLASARSVLDGKEHPIAFVLNHGEGRIFHCSLGHDAQALANPNVARLLQRAAAWVTGQPVAPIAPVTSPTIAFVAGPPSHGPGTHSWDEDTTLLFRALNTATNVPPVTTTLHLDGWPRDPAALAGIDALVLLSDGLGGHPIVANQGATQLRALAGNGVGLVFIHYALAPPPGHEESFLEWLGGYWEKDYSENPISVVEVANIAPEHPVGRGWNAYTLTDELYYRMRFREHDERILPIMTAPLPKNNPTEEVVAWAIERADGGRSFSFTGGHFYKNWCLDALRTMVLNAALWATDIEVPEGGVNSVCE